MLPHVLRYGLSVALLFALWAPAPAQRPPAQAPPPAADDEDYREFARKPETVAQFWDAVRFEVSVGRYSLAAGHLAGLLKKATDADLVKLEERVGMTPLLSLRDVTTWSDDPKVQAQAKKDVEEFIRRVRDAVRKHQGDPRRLQMLIGNLHATPEEYAYSVKELYKAGAVAIPYLIDALHDAEPGDRLDILSALERMDPATTTQPMLAALDSDDSQLKVDIINVFEKRLARHRGALAVAEREVVPRLWYLAASNTQSDAVRRKAAEALALFLDMPASRLPSAKVELTRLAERYYRHQEKFPDPQAVTVWRWERGHVVSGWKDAPTVSASRAEEYYGLYYARQALSLDPAYRPAQQVFLSLVLEKASGRDGGRPLSVADPAAHELLATVQPELVMAVLERALKENQVPVILAAVRDLGARAEVKATLPVKGSTSVLVKALYYPDRRVRMAAIEALLRIPDAAKNTAATTRVVDSLARTLAADPSGQPSRKVMVAVADADWRQRVRQAVEQAGYQAVPVATGREAMRRLRAAADIDAILLDSTLPDPGLASLLAQLRADADVGRVPVLVAGVVRSAAAHDLAARYRVLRDRLELLEPTIRPYEEAREALARDQAARMAKLRSEQKKDMKTERGAKQKAIQRLEDQFDLERKALAGRFRDAIKLEPEVTRLRGALRVAGADFTREGLRREEGLRRLASHYRNVWVVPAYLLTDARGLADALQTWLGAGPALSPAEMKDYAERSAQYLTALALGSPAGYDIRPAAGAILEALRAGKLSPGGQIALLTAAGAKLPGTRPQTEMVNIILNADRPIEVRLAAADQLIRAIQRQSPLLTRAQADSLASLQAEAKTPEKLKAALALVIGSLRPDARLTGERLRRYEPAVPAKLPPPKEGKK